MTSLASRSATERGDEPRAILMKVIDNRASLSLEDLSALESQSREWPTLEEVVRWAFRQQPPLLVTEVVVQDEFTHDVVFPYKGSTFLVFDTT